jgi:hypothetical protein
MCKKATKKLKSWDIDIVHGFGNVEVIVGIGISVE